ncbi:MAG: permease prefix domain 1-containing protein [Micrococcales bacterium]|nr:permease prefix domain 1-containing protein [Micrococcales bacterium]
MTSNISIHRLLDEAFAAATPSEATQDLKEELRANLMARVAELESDGLDASDAARQAFDELGDISGLVTDTAQDATPGRRPCPPRVRPSAAFVARATVVPIVATAVLAVAVLAALDITSGGPYLARGLVAVFAVLIGFVTTDSLLRETTGHYGMPRGRATGYGAGTGLVLLGGGLVALCRTDEPMWLWIALGGLLAVTGIGVLAGLGATQTNRTKPWMLAYADPFDEIGNRFETDPAAAARFGIYTGAAWVAALAAAAVVGFTIGWWWALLPGVVAVVVTMLLLTRMLFAPDRTVQR